MRRMKRNDSQVFFFRCATPLTDQQAVFLCRSIVWQYYKYLSHPREVVMSEQQSEKGDVHLRGVCISTICISISFRLCLLPFSEVMSTPSSLQLHFAQSWFLTQFVLLPTSSCFVPHDILLCSLCSILACLFFIYSLYCCSSVILRFCSRTCRQHILTKQKPLQFL